MIGALIGAGVVAVINVIAIAYSHGKLRQRVDDIPTVINGTVVRAHEARCCNFRAYRADPTNPGMEVLL